MALVPADVYRLSVGELRRVCSQENLNSTGPVSVLRKRLVCHLRARMSDTKHQGGLNQVSAQIDSPSNRARDWPQLDGVCSCGRG